MTNAMMNASIPIIVTDPLITREPPATVKRSLSLNTSALGNASGLKPRTMATPGISPTSKFHTEQLPQGVIPIEASDCSKISSFTDITSDGLVIDVRPFNMYSTSHLRASVNICVPSTILKRPKYDLAHVINASNLSASLKSTVMDEQKCMKVLFYDSNSVDEQVSFQLYHTLRKFLSHSRFELFYIRGGFDHVEAQFVENCSVSSIPSPMSPATPDSARSANDMKNMLTLNGPQKSTQSSDGMPFLTGFSLPSATSADNKLLMSIKKNLPKIDTSTSYRYNFHFPANFEEKMSRLPKWLSFFSEFYGKENSNQLIVEKFNDMFSRLEAAEQVRLRMAISNIDKDSDLCRNLDKELHGNSGYGTPSTLCPCCDPIEYTIPQGVEYGYKNRYNNIWPYEHSRVHLISSPSCTQKKESGDDYFNANYISFKRLSQRRYIATQSPLNSTKDDFWSTVWYNGVKAIVCLATAPVFGERPYYEYDQILEKSKLFITIKSSEQHDSFTLREITLSRYGKSRTVFHFAYEKWPDFGTPDELKSVFDLMQTKNEKLAPLMGQKPSSVKTKESWDVLVHCSAGCGRTGCYITMDMLVDSFENANNIHNHYDPWGEDDLVYKSVQFQRQQRISMVQNLDQFIFCYESILNYIVSNLIQ